MVGYLALLRHNRNFRRLWYGLRDAGVPPWALSLILAGVFFISGLVMVGALWRRWGEAAAEVVVM